MRAPTGADIAAGETILAIDNVSLSFGGVKAITDVSFDIRQASVRDDKGPQVWSRHSLRAANRCEKTAGSESNQQPQLR